MTAEADRGLWELTRRDGAVLVRLFCNRNFPPSAVEQAFPDSLLFTVSPTGAATVVSIKADAVVGLTRLPVHPAEICPAISVIRAAGDGMGAADNRARRICARLAEEGIPVRALSLCDIGAAFALDTVRADRAMELIRTEFLLPG